MSKAQATEHIKKQYQTRFQKNNYEAYNELQGSQWLRKNRIDSPIKFKRSVDKISDDFYSFIQVR